MIFWQASAQEIIWKGKELQSATYKIIEGEITIQTQEDTIRASKAILYNDPKKAILKGGVSLRRKGTLVTGDSAIYYPAQRRVDIVGNGIIHSKEGMIRSKSFQYDLNTKQLTSNSETEGTANGVRFQADRSVIFAKTQNMKLSGHARWENDTITGVGDTIYLDKENNMLKMSRNAKISFKKKKDEVAGKLIELDLTTSKIARIEGSVIKRDDGILKAKRISQKGDDYYLNEEVEIGTPDSTVISIGQKAVIRKGGMDMSGPTVTRLRDKEKKETIVYAPKIITSKDSGREVYRFYRLTNIRGQLSGFGDSLVVKKKDSVQTTTLYHHAHLQNDSMYVEADTLILYQDSIRDIIEARRNAMMIMITKPARVNIIQAAYITLTKNDSISTLYANGSAQSDLWNDEKSNVGLNHTEAATQKATIRKNKISRVKTTGKTTSSFFPIRKVNYAYMDDAALRLKETYKADTLAPGLKPVRNFLERVKR